MLCLHARLPRLCLGEQRILAVIHHRAQPCRSRYQSQLPAELVRHDNAPCNPRPALHRPQCPKFPRLSVPLLLQPSHVTNIRRHLAVEVSRVVLPVVCALRRPPHPYPAGPGLSPTGTLRPRRSIKCRKISSGERSFSASERAERASRMTSDRFACGHPSSRRASTTRSAAATSSGRRLAAMIR